MTVCGRLNRLGPRSRLGSDPTAVASAPEATHRLLPKLRAMKFGDGSATAFAKAASYSAGSAPASTKLSLMISSAVRANGIPMCESAASSAPSWVKRQHPAPLEDGRCPTERIADPGLLGDRSPLHPSSRSRWCDLKNSAADLPSSSTLTTMSDGVGSQIPSQFQRRPTRRYRTIEDVANDPRSSVIGEPYSGGGVLTFNLSIWASTGDSEPCVERRHSRRWKGSTAEAWSWLQRFTCRGLTSNWCCC